jgi:hypothetical protein
MKKPDDVLEIKIDISPDLARKLTRVGKILGKRYGRKCDLPEAMNGMAELFLERLDPERRASRLSAKILQRKKRPEERPLPLPKPSVPSALKLNALRRDRSQCRFPKEDGPCGNRKRVDVFPRKQMADTRQAKLKDVITLCSHHWKAMGPEILGRSPASSP